MTDSIGICDILERQVYPALGVERIYRGCTFQTRDEERWRGAGPFRESRSGTSFVVNPKSFLWWDEGLRAGGGPLQFRHRVRGGNGSVRGQDFIGAARELFDEAGVPFPQKDLPEEETRRLQEREQRAFVVETLSGVCAATLQTAEGDVAREYLQSRGISDDAAKQLGLGLYHDHNEIRKLLEVAGVQLPENRRENGFHQDLSWWSLRQLEGYITFPWLDAYGRGLTIYGRWPGTPPSEKPKTWALIGSSSKRSPLYLDRARAAGIKHVRLVEGVIDAGVAQTTGDASVIACVAASLSKEQGATLARCGIEAVTICLDPDSAGENGTPSCIKTLEPYNIDIFVAPKLPDGLDPDEFMIQRGIKAWEDHCQQAEHGYRWTAKQILALAADEVWTDLRVQQAWRRADAFARSVTASHRKPDLERYFWPTIRTQLGEPSPMPPNGASERGEIATGEASDDWPEPTPLQAELPPVEPFREELLPVSFRPLAKDVAERMQVPLDYPAATLVLCLAGAVNRRAVMQPKANDTEWRIVPNLWGGIVAPPGYLKSPVIQASTRALNRIQAEWRTDYEQALKDHARVLEDWELRKSAWRDVSKQRLKKGQSSLDRPEDAPDEPKLRRLIVNDATFEAMHETMSENPAGILVIRDELTGWWSQLDRAGREGERAFCLQAWNGDTGHTIDRIGRGTIHVPACCMSMLGGIQPGRLGSYLTDTLKDGPSNDGLIQRFQVLVWPDTNDEWKYVDRPPNLEAEQQVVKIFRQLVELDPDNPVLFCFAPDAQQLFVEWLAELERKIRGSELHPALISHLSKYRSLMPSLAVLFELADRAAEGSVGFVGDRITESVIIHEVSLQHTSQAVAWCAYLESQSKRIYSCAITPQVRAARELADKIKQRKTGADGFFSCRDVYLKGWSSLDTPEAVKAAAEILQDAGWVRDVTSEPGPFGGRPSNRYQVNPKVWQ